MKKENFYGIDLRKMAANHPLESDILMKYISNIDHSDLNLHGMTIDEIYHVGVEHLIGKNGKEKDSWIARKYFYAAAIKGHSKSQHNLACLYKNDAYPNFTKAMYWHKEAANSGNTESKYDIGLMYCRGEGVEQDYEQAIKWLKRAGDDGHAEAWNKIGSIYYNIKEYRKSDDYLKAFTYFYKGAKAGDIIAQYNLGIAYMDDNKLKQDFNAALYCFEKAANNGKFQALKKLDELYKTGKAKNSKYKSAAEWLHDSEHGDDAAVELAYISRKLYTYDKDYDYDQAIFWYEQAAEKGNFKAFEELISLYSYGDSFGEVYVFKPNSEKAAYWAKKLLTWKREVAETVMHIYA